MKRIPRVRYTEEAGRDFDRCRHFLRRHSPENAWRRTRQLLSAVRRIRENPEINAVREISPKTGLLLRRCNVAQFVIVYVYFRPSALEPDGLVSLRAFRHASEEDVFWEVHEQAAADALSPRRPFLSTRVRPAWAPCQPLTTYGEITFTPNEVKTDAYDIHRRSR